MSQETTEHDKGVVELAGGRDREVLGVRRLVVQGLPSQDGAHPGFQHHDGLVNVGWAEDLGE